MFGFGFRQYLNNGRGGMGEERLDRPVSNFDVAGIPIAEWHSGLFCCHKNFIPSCWLAFCCPCKLWSQIVVRAQIPLFISIKNSLGVRLQLGSGYRVFIDMFWIPLALIISLVLIVVLVKPLQKDVRTLLLFFLFAVGIVFAYINGHVRVAVREKYLLPGFIPVQNGCAVPNCMLDMVVSCLCLPCSLAQLARHIFQYERWSPHINFSLGDPSKLEPLEESHRRPERADRAGLQWADHQRPDDIRQYTGAGARERMQDERAEAREGTSGPVVTVPPSAVSYPPAYTATSPTHMRNVNGGSVPIATVVEPSAPPSLANTTYNADGTIYRP
jgi:Cys-rich protein (TIGR01571 family)